jgi:hypothetical protein
VSEEYAGASELVERNRKNYGRRVDVELTEDLVQRHRVLETELIKKILSCDKSPRHEVIQESYDRLYKEISWLNFDLDTSKNVTDYFGSS